MHERNEICLIQILRGKRSRYRDCKTEDGMHGFIGGCQGEHAKNHIDFIESKKNTDVSSNQTFEYEVKTELDEEEINSCSKFFL